MPSELCTPTAPVNQLIDRLAVLIEDGPEDVAGFPESPYVVGFTGGAAPAHHFLCQAGMKLHKGSQPAAAKPPFVVIWNHAKSTRHQTNFGKLWDVPITVQFHYDKTLPPDDFTEKSEQLELLLFTDYQSASAASRMSVVSTTEAEGIRVRYLDDISIDEFKVATDAGHTAYSIVQVVFTAKCSGLQKLP